MSENETIGCIALVAMFVPVILLIIALAVVLINIIQGRRPV